MDADFLGRLNPQRKLLSVYLQGHHAERGRNVDYVNFRAWPQSMILQVA